MKILLVSLISSLALINPAHAFISTEEQAQLLSSMNKINPSQVQFEDIRCSMRSRMCLIRLVLGAEKLPVGCSIERINGSEDLFVDNGTSLQLSVYSRQALDQCLAGFVK